MSGDVGVVRAKPDEIETIAEKADELGMHLAWWEQRESLIATGHVRESANKALDAIDTMLAELHGLRARLAGEMRASDDAAMKRAWALAAEFQTRHQGDK